MCHWFFLDTFAKDCTTGLITSDNILSGQLCSRPTHIRPTDVFKHWETPTQLWNNLHSDIVQFALLTIIKSVLETRTRDHSVAKEEVSVSFILCMYIIFTSNMFFTYCTQGLNGWCETNYIWVERPVKLCQFPQQIGEVRGRSKLCPSTPSV